MATKDDTCECLGLGVKVSFNDSTANPAYEVRVCAEHTADGKPGDCEDAAQSVGEYLQALADVREILWPGGNADAEWSADTVDEIARRLNFLRPKEG